MIKSKDNYAIYFKVLKITLFIVILCVRLKSRNEVNFYIDVSELSVAKCLLWSYDTSKQYIPLSSTSEPNVSTCFVYTHLWQWLSDRCCMCLYLDLVHAYNIACKITLLNTYSSMCRNITAWFAHIHRLPNAFPSEFFYCRSNRKFPIFMINTKQYTDISQAKRSDPNTEKSHFQYFDGLSTNIGSIMCRVHSISM